MASCGVIARRGGGSATSRPARTASACSAFARAHRIHHGAQDLVVGIMTCQAHPSVTDPAAPAIAAAIMIVMGRCVDWKQAYRAEVPAADVPGPWYLSVAAWRARADVARLPSPRRPLPGRLAWNARLRRFPL